MLHLSTCLICQNDKLSHLIEVKAQMHPSEEKYNYDQCSSCNLVMLNPRVAPDKLALYYTEYYLPYRGADAWGKYKAMVEKDMKRLDKRRVKVLNNQQKLTENTTILDIGCGKPSFLYTASQCYSVKGIGIDFSDYGWRDQPKLQQDLRLIKGELDQLKLETQPDFITMWHYLEHDYFPDKTLRQAKRLSSDDTHLIIEVPNFASKSRKKYGAHWAGWHTPRHTFLFSPNNLVQLLANTGWKIKELHTYGTLSDYLLYWMSEMEVKNIDWRKNMEDEFWKFAKGQTILQFSNLFKAKQSHGIMLAIATPNGSET